MKKTIILTLALFFTLLSASKAQDNAILLDDMSLNPTAPAISGASAFLHKSLLSINYNLSLPMADFKDFISPMGYRGWNIELRVFALEKLAVGGGVGWYGFFEKRERDTYIFENGALTSTIFTYLYSVPLTAKVEYFISPASYVQPYIALNVGTHYNNRRMEVGYYLIEDNTWNFSMAPEAGIIIPFGSNADWGFNVKARYNFQIYNRERMDNLMWLDIGFGFTYSY